MSNKNPALEAKKRMREEATIVTLPTGERARLTAVTGSVIADMVNDVEDPPVPIITYEDKPGKEFPNPDDPKYIKALDDTNMERALVTMDAYLIMGVELLDPIPKDDAWLKKLRYLSKRHKLKINWDDYDLDDPDDREFVYKKYIAVPTNVVDQVVRLSGLSEEGVTAAEDSFQDN